MVTPILLECGGALVVLWGLREVFRDIFHPTRSGSLSDYVGRFASLLMRHTRLRPAVGPIALVAVILCWVALIVAGFALIYCAVLPTDLMGAPGSTEGSLARKFLRGLYFSLGSLDTFQTFDLSPRSDWLRLLVAVEGLIGISMITASVSWLVLLYPALSRTRQFARRASSLLQAQQRCGISFVREIGAPVLMELADSVLQYRLDIILFPILLNFYPSDEGATISRILPEIQRFASDAMAADRVPATRFAGAQLHVALELLAQVLGEQILAMPSRSMEEVFGAFQKREE